MIIINLIISERSKLAQKEYKTRHNWMGKVIHRELCIHNPESVRENGFHKIL